MRFFTGKIVLTVLIFSLLVWKIDFQALAAILSSVSPYAVAAGATVVLVQSLLSAKRLSMIVARFGVCFPNAVAIRTTLEGMFFSQTFISFFGGDALRIWRVRQTGLPLAGATSAVALDRLVGILVNHVFLLCSLPWLLLHVEEVAVRVALIFLAIAGITGFAFVLLFGLLRGRMVFPDSVRNRIPFAGFLGTFADLISGLGPHFCAPYPNLLRLLLVSFTIAAANICCFAVLLLGFGVDLSTAVRCSLFIPAILEIAMLPVAIAGWGLREGAAVFALGALGVPSHLALASSILFGLVIAAVSLLGGALWLLETDKKVPAQL